MPSDQDLLAQAKQAERDLNSHDAKSSSNLKDSGRPGASDSATESGVDSSVESKFAAQGAKVTYGSAASGAGDNREIPESEGGDVAKNGRTTKAKDFEGVGGPEDKQELDRQNRGGDNDVDSNTQNPQQKGDGSVKNS